ncbi:MAG: hypothetical protein IPP84_15470 [Propionivibrio sp.]|uniref:hypothetical protein n=1 Tax=Propionivibrio sp. TaxID=2212460 RepID=UPI0025E82EA9|nr:hypothetical protein [Propionivibrio sp.]MBL0209275.1 hypothetical protein [Propionivibrio sp.]
MFVAINERLFDVQLERSIIVSKKRLGRHLQVGVFQVIGNSWGMHAFSRLGFEDFFNESSCLIAPDTYVLLPSGFL